MTKIMLFIWIIHFNPVKHGVAGTPGAWPNSSFRHCAARGLYPASWRGEERDLPTVGKCG